MLELVQAVQDGKEIEIELKILRPYTWEKIRPLGHYLYGDLEQFIKDKRLRVIEKRPIEAQGVFSAGGNTINQCHYTGTLTWVIRAFEKEMKQRQPTPIWGCLFNFETGAILKSKVSPMPPLDSFKLTERKID